MKKTKESQFINAYEIKELFESLKQCSDNDLLLIMALCEVIFDDRKKEVEDV